VLTPNTDLKLAMRPHTDGYATVALLSALHDGAPHMRAMAISLDMPYAKQGSAKLRHAASTDGLEGGCSGVFRRVLLYGTVFYAFMAVRMH
jgi:hypothetical protein